MSIGKTDEFQRILPKNAMTPYGGSKSKDVILATCLPKRNFWLLFRLFRAIFALAVILAVVAQRSGGVFVWGGRVEIIGKAMAGHFLDSDSGAVGRNHPRYANQYANPLSDYVSLVVAEVKSRGRIDLNEAVMRQRTMQEKWRLRREQRAADEAMTSGLPLFSLVGD